MFDRLATSANNLQGLRERKKASNQKRNVGGVGVSFSSNTQKALCGLSLSDV